MNQYVYSLRINLIPGENFQDRLASLVEYCQQYFIGDVMFFIDAEEYNSGHTTVETAVPYVQALKEAKKALNLKGISLSLNPWCSFGHGDRGRKASFSETMVDVDGEKAELTACPLSEVWRKNFLQVYEYYARELSPKVLWIEDDFRLHNHAPLHYGGCFCEEHMRLYGKKIDRKLSRQEFVRGLYAKETNEVYRRAYFEVNQEIYNQITSEIRARLSKYDVCLGLMTSDPNMYAIEGRDNREVLSGLDLGNGIYNRIHLPMYSEVSPLLYGWGVNTLSLLSRFYCPENTTITPEVENYPHGYYSKSAKMTAFQLESTLPLLADGSTLNIFDFGGNGVLFGKKYGEQLHKLLPYFDRVAKLDIDFNTMSGVVVPVGNDSVIKMNTTHGRDIMELYPFDNWWAGMLGSFGVNFCYSDKKSFCGKTVAIAGQWLKTLSNAQIVKLFEDNRILLDAKAVICLLEIGLGWLVGIDSYEVLPQNEDVYHYQLDEKGALPIANAKSPAQFGCGNLVKFGYHGERTEFTGFWHRDGKRTAAGIVQVGNALIFPFEGYERALGLLHPLYERVISNFILTDKNCYHVKNDNISIYRFRNVLMLVNYSLDDQKNISIENLDLSEASCLTAESLEWKPADDLALSALSSCVIVVHPHS